MSTDTAAHLPPAYQQGPPQAAPPLATLGDSTQANRYQDSDQSAPQSPAVPPATKGKNGATGPAEGKPKPHVCPICQRGFTTGGHLQRHQRIHTGVKAFKCPYPGCETRTSRQDNLQQHYRTHLSPTLRRGSGTAARQAVAAAMMAAGLKSSTSRQSRKSKGSQVGTPGSTSSASTMHGQSPYQTPTQASAPYGGYMYDASQQHNGASYPYAPGVSSMTAQTQSAQSSRVPSPVNGHSTASSMHSAQQQHQQQFYPQQQPFYTAYPGSTYGQPYRYSPGGAPIPSAYGPPSHHHLYSPGVAPEHGGQQHMYSPIQSFTPNSRDQYNVLAQGYPQAQMGNGYPPRTQSSTPLSATHDELDPRYRTAQRTPSSPRRRLTPPQAEMLSTGVVDPSSMSTNASGHSAAPRASLGAVSASPYSYASNGYASYGAHGMAPNGRDGAPVTLARANVEDSDTKAFKHE